MVDALLFAVVVSTPQPHEISAHSPRGTAANITYWLMPSPRDDVGPVIGGGTLRLTSGTHALLIPFSRLGIVRKGSSWKQFIVNPQMACFAEPISFGRASNGHDEIIVRYALVGKGCLPRATVIDATTGSILSSQ